MVFSQLAIAEIGECPLDISPFLAMIGPAPAENTAAGDYASKVWTGHQALAMQVYQRFASQQLSSQDLNKFATCLKKPMDFGDLNLALNSIFRDESLKRIQQINPLRFAQISKNFNVGQIVFQVFNSHVNSQKLAESILGQRPAGYNMQTRALFMNMAQITVDDWDILFIHEMGHYLDPIDSNISFFNDANNLEKISVSIKNFNQNKSLTQNELQFIDVWLTHGLNIRLLAEWRVWNFTVDYLSLRKDIPMGPKTIWLQPYLTKDVTQRKIELFNFLDRNFVNPIDQIFSNPLIQKRINLIRQSLREQIANGRFPK